MSARGGPIMGVLAVQSLIASLVEGVEVDLRMLVGREPSDLELLKICEDGIAAEMDILASDESDCDCRLKAAASLGVIMFNAGAVLARYSPATAAAIRRDHMEAVRPKRDVSARDGIADVLRRFDPAKESAFKFAQAAAQELKDAGIPVSERTIRRELAKLDNP